MQVDVGAGDAVYRGCVLPPDLYYSVPSDVWVRLEADGLVTLGMTDPAQTRCGKVVHVAFRRAGRRIERGKSIATIESAKWVGPLPSPMAGELIAANTASFEHDILIANRDPYGAGWLARLRPSDLAADLADLRTGESAVAAYRERIDELGIRCYRCVD